jgi:hypothetical protein
MDKEQLKCELCGLDFEKDQQELDYNNIDETGRCVDCYAPLVK